MKIKIENVAEIDQRIGESGSIYVISSEIDLLGNVMEVPANCVLKFEQGGLLKNGTLEGYNTFIDAGVDVVFRDMSFDRKSGEISAFVNEIVRPEWFFVSSDDNNDDDSLRINASIEMASISGNKVQLLPKVYKIYNAINIYSGTVLEGTIFGAVDRNCTQGTRLKYVHNNNNNVTVGVAMEFYCAGGDDINNFQKTCFKFKVSNLSIEYGESWFPEASPKANSLNYVGMRFGTGNKGSAPRNGLLENIKILGFGTGIDIQALSYVRFNTMSVDHCLNGIKISKKELYDGNDGSVDTFIEFAWFDKIIINVGERCDSDIVTGIEINSGNNLYFNEIDVNDCNTGILVKPEKDLFNVFMNRMNITRCYNCVYFNLNGGHITRFRVSEITLDYSKPSRKPSENPNLRPFEYYGLRFTRSQGYIIGDSSFSDIYDSTCYENTNEIHKSISVDTDSGLTLFSVNFEKLRLLNKVEGLSNIRKLGLINFKSFGELTIPAMSLMSEVCELMSKSIFDEDSLPKPIIVPVGNADIVDVCLISNILTELVSPVKLSIKARTLSSEDRVYRFYFPQIN